MQGLDTERLLGRVARGEAVFAVWREAAPQREFAARSRRDSSLRFICAKILGRHHGRPESEIRLNEFARTLGVERRRIYDIVNILEGFEVVRKREKNVYLWKGVEGFLAKLRRLAAGPAPAALFRFEQECPVGKKKSLTLMSIYFLRNLAASQAKHSFKGLISLFSENVLSRMRERRAPGDDPKTKVRRLYDIINVFKALGLVKKTTEGKKTLFYWAGEEGLRSQLPCQKKVEGFRVCPAVSGMGIETIKKMLVPEALVDKENIVRIG